MSLEERQSLLVRHRGTRSNSLAESLVSIKDYIKEKYPSRTTLKFIAALIWGLFAICVFNLIFLPRTSLARDYRRIHFSTLSKEETERLFLKSLRDTNNAREYLEYYSNMTNSPEDESMVDYTIGKFKEFGFSPYVKKYYTYMNQHVNNGLTLLDVDGKTIHTATLEEDVIDADPSSKDTCPAFHGYSASGNVTGEFIYANYGSEEDYRLLKENNVNTEGKIHIIRYNKLFRGLKVKHAELAGAIGVVLYTDPYDDGEITEKNGFKPYPEGPARNPSSIQRGSVGYFTDMPGDPTTPGFASRRTFRREDPTDRMPKIPSLPISQRDAGKILKHINGKGSTLNWTGNLDEYDYSTGPSNYTLNLFNEQDYKILPVTNIFYEIPGLSKEKIIIGNHRDSWCSNGAGDPNSGSAVLLEISRAFGDLVKKGWKPQRTIVVASWDGEEYAMLGSTEFGEDNPRDLKNSVMAYLNLDMGVAGPKLQVDSNPLLNSFLVEVSKDVPFHSDPDYSVYDYWKSQDGNHIDVLGSGSDFTVFQHHLGIPSCMVSFNINGHSQAYHVHSKYDSFHWIEKFIDPGFKYHNTLAAYFGFLALSFSEHEVIEFKTSNYAKFIKDHFMKYSAEVPHSWLEKTIPHGKHQSILLQELLQIIEDNLSAFINAATVFDAKAAKLQDQISIDYPWFKAYKKLYLAVKIKLFDNISNKLDRSFLYEKGLTGRPWMKHIILAPDRSTGYRGDVLPGLHEALRDEDFDEFVKWLNIINVKIQSVTNHLTI